MEKFFGAKGYKKRVVKNVRKIGYKEFRGMLLSISYIPDIKDPKYPKMMKSLRKIFNKYQDNGELTSKYNTEIIYGKF